MSSSPDIRATSATVTDRTTVRFASVVLALTTAMAACGGGGVNDDGAPPSSGASSLAALPRSVDYSAPARPLNVVVALDQAAVQEVDVPLAGATLVVTGANGTRYTLAIPGNALRSPTRVRMQAVSALDGVPTGIEAVHGVQLEPAGLHFIEAATLTIEPATAVPIARQAFYGYQGAGADLHPVPGELGPAARLRITHFSGYGMATLARESSVSSVFVDVVPAGLEARLRGAMAIAFGQARDGTITDAQLNAAVEALLTQYENEVLTLLRAAAPKSCANAITAFSADLGNSRQRQLLGIGGDDPTNAVQTMKTLRSVCFEEANKRCRVSGNVEQLLVDHLGLERQAELIGAGDGAATAREETAIDKCGRYELQFDSTLTYDGAGAPNPFGFGRLSVATRVPIKLSGGLEKSLEGEAQIAHTDTMTRFNCSMLGCSYYLVQTTRPDTALVQKGVPRFTPLQGIDIWALGQPVEQVGSFMVEFNPQSPGEDIDVIVDGGPLGIINANRAGGLPPTAETLWAGFYSLVNQSEIGASGFYVWESDWTQGKYPVMFERSRAPSIDNALAHFVAITSVRLVHKPA